jgi:hypothetical protein
MWKFRGIPHYLDQQGDRLGIARTTTDRARHDSSMYRISVLLGQLTEVAANQTRDDGTLVVDHRTAWSARFILRTCEEQLQQLHALAAASRAMIDEAHAAFGLEPPARTFRVQCDTDDRETP